jgi:uridine kinase
MLIGLAGGSGSGKTTLARRLVEALGTDPVTGEARCAVLAQDHYYIDQSERFDGDGGSVNFDHPSSIDFPLLAQHARELLQHRGIDVPIYDFASHTRNTATHRFAPRPLLIIEGTLIFANPELSELFDLRVFISTSEKVRFERRLRRDTLERGRTPEGVRRQFELQVKPMHDQFVEPSQKVAHLVVSGEVSIEDGLKAVLTRLR